MPTPIGGQFLLAESNPANVLTPEDFTAEHRAIAEAANQFVDGEVMPKVAALEAHEPGLAQSLMRKAAALGFLGLDTPEQFGGLGLDVISSSLVSESMGRQGSWAVCIGAHAGIGTLPLVFFGNDEQRRRYLPRLASGELLGAYALSETSSGSDALAAKTKAVLSDDGTHYVLTGEKMWISNGAFADLITVFAQLEGAGFTAFLVERNFPGVSSGREEHKLGIRGSSTTRILLEGARVPRENLLYTPRRGHVVALNILNLGRYKLAVGMLGAARESLRIAVRYAQERKQFGKAIVEFGLIRAKLADMAVRLFATESACYRLGGLIQQRLDDATDTADGLPPKVQALEEFLVECALMKVHASEMLDFVVDEALQIHGGYGYTEEFTVARAYRDARINRIFEGTNEINRLAAAGTLLRRAQGGRLPLVAACKEAARIATSHVPEPADECEPLGHEQKYVEAMRQLVLLLCGLAAEHFGEHLGEEQEVLAALADMVTELFVIESATLRTLKCDGANFAMVAATRVVVFDGVQRLDQLARIVAATCAEGDELTAQLALLRKFTRGPGLDTIALRRIVADAVVERGEYPWR